MKTNWQIKKLGEIAKIQAGYGFPKNIQGKLSGDFPFIKVGDMNYQKQEIYLGISENYLDQNNLKENGYKIIPAGTIIFPKIGGAIATNKKRILAVDSLYDNNVMGIIPTDVVSSEYLYYWLNTKNLSDWASGTSLPAINKSTIEAEEIPLPPLATQRKIVAILDEKFAKLRDAKQLRQEATLDTEKILATTLREIFEKGKEKGWEEDILNNVATKVADGTHDTPKYQNEGYPLITSKNLLEKGLDFSNVKYISEEDYVQIGQRSGVHRGDLLIAMIGTIGNITMVETDQEFSIKNVGLIKPDEEKVLGKYLMYFLHNSRLLSLIECKGATQKFIALGPIRNIKIQFPPLAEQKKIVTHLDALSEKLRTLRELQQSQLEDMKKLEKAYLREAFNGELC